MPLSEDERRILSEIEQQLYETDPGLAHEVSSTTVFSHGFRHIRLAAIAFVAGLAVLVLSLSVSYLLSFVGFLIMLASAWYGERNLRRVGKASLQKVTQSASADGGVRGYFGDAGQRMRDRLNQEDGTEED
jgi:membrane protein implicated in regulation of membrane protease activity